MMRLKKMEERGAYGEGPSRAAYVLKPEHCRQHSTARFGAR